MKFIIPQNYDTSSKLFGFLDYSSGIIIILWSLFIFSLVNFFINYLYIKIIIFIILCFPVYLFSFVGLNHENIIYILSYLIKYLLSKNYIYIKNIIK